MPSVNASKTNKRGLRQVVFRAASPTPLFRIIGKIPKNSAMHTIGTPILGKDRFDGFPRKNYPKLEEKKSMQVKVYTPRIIEIASEYLPALAKRAADSLGERANEISATRGHLVRQAVQDGLLREFDDLIGEDGTVDLVCDPGMEIPLELENRTLTLTELLEALHYKRTWAEMKSSRDAA